MHEIDEHAWYSELRLATYSESSDDPSACSANAQYVAAVGAYMQCCSAVLYSAGER